MLVFDFECSPRIAGTALAFGNPIEVIVANRASEVMPALQQLTEAVGRGFYAAGMICYEAAAGLDPAMQVKEMHGLPLLWFGLYESPVAPPTAGLAAYQVGEWQSDIDADRYRQVIDRIRAAIHDGEIYQANFTFRLNAPFSGNPLAWYEDLRGGAHGRMNAFLDLGDQVVLSMSPELFFSWDGTDIETRPMKGTAKRFPALTAADDISAWATHDAAIASALQNSEKNRAENLMIVDLLRNDLSRVALHGSVRVPRLFEVERYPTVYQMTSTVTARTRPGTTIADVLRALFPCGSITGTPKIQAMQRIAELESTPRGPYCGAIGYITPNGQCRFNVAIRTVTIDKKKGMAQCGVGGGITWGSNSEDEYAEALAKGAFLAVHRHGFELLETLRLANGRYDWLDNHLDRLCQSADALGFVAHRDTISIELARYAERYPGQTRRVRLRLAQSGALNLESVELVETASPAWSVQNALPGTSSQPVVLSTWPVEATNEALWHKTTRRSIYDARRQRHPDCFDVLLQNECGEITEFTTGNLVIESQGQWLTPASACGLLPGVLRSHLLKQQLITEQVLRATDLQNAQSLWFINSVRGWVRVCLAV